MMPKTTVMVEFSIYGRNFDPEYITKLLGIVPTLTYLEGDLLKNGKIARKETAWEISTGHEVSIDINVQIDKVMLLLKDKEKVLKELKDRFNLSTLFMIVIYAEKNDLPAIYLTKPFIHFVSKIDAEVGFDTYVY